MSLEIPAEAARMQALLDYDSYRRWWLVNVIQPASTRPPKLDDEAG